MDDEVSPVDHFWCSDLHWISKHVNEFLEWVLGQTSSAPWWAREAQSDLDTCWECVLQYHSLIEDEVLSCSAEEKQKIFCFDRERLQRILKEKLESVQKLSHVATLPATDIIDLSIDDDDDENKYIIQSYMSQDATILHSSVSVPLREVLMYPQYLHSDKVSRVFVSLLSALIDSDGVMNVTEKMAGIYMLLVHPDEKVQRWAVEQVRALSTITIEEYEDGIDEAIAWVLSVAQNGLLTGEDILPCAGSSIKENKAVLASSKQSPVWDQATPTVLPHHLFSSTHPKVYWVGMCMLLKALDGRLLQSEQFWLKAARYGPCTLADAVVKAIHASHYDTSGQDYESGSSSDDEDEDDPILLHSMPLSVPSESLSSRTAFRPALQCFITLTERLSAYFWEYTSYTPVQIIEEIVSNCHYCKEVADRLKYDASGSTLLSGEVLLSPVSECADEDNLITCSQMVYDWSTSAPGGRDDAVSNRRSKQKKRRGHNEVLQWCEPFVCSLMEHSDQQVIFDSVSLLTSHLWGLYDSIVREYPGESRFQLSHHSVIAAMCLAQLLKLVAILLQSKQFNIAKVIASLAPRGHGPSKLTHPNKENDSWLSLAVEVVTEAAGSAPVDGSQFAPPVVPPHQQAASTLPLVPECVPPACQVVTTLLGGLHSARNIINAVNSLSAKCVLRTPAPVPLLSGSALVAVTPDHMLGGWRHPTTSATPFATPSNLLATPSNPFTTPSEFLAMPSNTFAAPSNILATPSNPFAKESHHLRMISTLDREELIAMLRGSLEEKAAQDTHEQFNPRLSSRQGSSPCAGVTSFGGPSRLVAVNEDQLEEMKEEEVEDVADAEMSDVTDMVEHQSDTTEIESDENSILSCVTKESPVAMVTSSKPSLHLPTDQSLSHRKSLQRSSTARKKVTVLWSSDSDDDDFVSSPAKDIKKRASSGKRLGGNDLSAKLALTSPSKKKKCYLIPPKEEQVLKEKARQCNCTLVLPPVPAEKWALGRFTSQELARKSVPAGRDVKGLAVSSHDTEEATTESMSEEEMGRVLSSSGKWCRLTEGHAKSKAEELTGSVGHLLAQCSVEEKKEKVPLSGNHSSTATLSDSDSDSDFNLPEVKIRSLTSGKPVAIQTAPDMYLTQRKDPTLLTQSMKIDASLATGKVGGEDVNFTLSNADLAEFDDFGADFGASSNEDDDGKVRASGHDVVDLAGKMEREEMGRRTAYEKPSPRARGDYQTSLDEDDDEECEQEDPLLSLPPVSSTLAVSTPGEVGGLLRALPQLVKGSGGTSSPALVASYHSEEVAPKAQKAAPTLFKDRVMSYSTDSSRVTTQREAQAPVLIPPPAVPSLVAPHTMGPSELRGLSSTHAVGASHPTVDSKVTSQVSGTVTSVASSCSTLALQCKPVETVTSEHGSVTATLPPLMPEDSTSGVDSRSTAMNSVQKVVTQSDSDSDMSPDDTNVTANPLGGLLSDKMKLQKREQLSTKTAKASTSTPLVALLKNQLVKQSPAVVKSAPFSKSRAPMFASGNVATKVCRKPAPSAEGILKPDSNVTRTATQNVNADTKSSTVSAGGLEPPPPRAPSKLSSIRIDLTPRPAHSMDELLALVLSWNAELFLHPQKAADGRFIHPAPECAGIQTQTLKHVPFSFTSVSQYFNVYAPLFVLEIWDSLTAEMRDSSNLLLPFSSTVESIFGDVGIIRQLRCHGYLTQQQARDYAHPVERDLVVLTLSNGVANQIEGEETANWRVFGIVDSMRQIRGGSEGAFRGRRETRKEAEGASSSAANKDVALSLVIKVHALALPCIREGGSVTVTTVMSFTTYLRQWCALINMHKLSLARQLLYPVGGRYFGAPAGTSLISRPGQDEQMDGGARSSGEKRYNWSQKAIIESTVSCACEPYTMPRMVLLQGPPGTGKTYTIVGLIKSFFESYHKRSITATIHPAPAFQDPRLKKLAQPHLLVCTPSNAGIDEIVWRLMAEGLVVGTSQWRQKQAHQSTDVLKEVNANSSRPRGNPLRNGLKVIRVGRESKMHPSVLPLSLDTLAKCKLAEEAKRMNQEQANLQDKLAKIAQDVSYVESKIQTARKTDSEDVTKLVEERRVLQKKQKDYQRQRSGLKAHQSSQLHQAIIRRKLLQNADIVCCTLASSGSKALEECFLGNPLHFTCTVIDEATQCCELDVLIPLRYGSSKVVLVGDPLQLPATVRSQQAKKFGYDLSLFERMYKYFKSEFDESPVKMLQVQYRMLPEICHFPALHFYEGRLQTHDKVQSQPRPPLKPCLLFNVQGGREESGEGSSLCNPAECSLVMEICHVLRERVNQKEIGVITPYKAQEKMIRRKLNMPNIEVGTVDGFQGREKHAIILSCVRAKTFAGSIGFLSDGRRMNVALTRAKFALYIVCHKSSLQVSPDWRALIAHAEERKWVVEVTPQMSAASAAQQIKLPPSAAHTVRSSSVMSTTQSHGRPSNSNPCGRGEQQSSDSSHTQHVAMVDEVTPKSSGNQLLHCTPDAPGVTARDVRKRQNVTDAASEAKRVKPAAPDSHVPQVQRRDTATPVRSDTTQLDCNHGTVQAETKTTPFLPPQPQPGLLPTPPIGVKPGSLSNLGFNPGPKRRVAHAQSSAQWRSNHDYNKRSRCPHFEKPNKKAVGQQRQLARHLLQNKRSRHK